MLKSSGTLPNFLTTLERYSDNALNSEAWRVARTSKQEDAFRAFARRDGISFEPTRVRYHITGHAVRRNRFRSVNASRCGHDAVQA